MRPRRSPSRCRARSGPSRRHPPSPLTVDGSSPHGGHRLPRRCIETGFCAVMHLPIPCPRSRDAADDRPFHHRQSPTRRRRSSRDVDAGRAAAVPRRPRRPRAARSPAGAWTSRWTGGRGGRGCARGGCGRGLADALRERMARTGVFTFDHLPYYAGLHDDDVRAGRAAYLECRVPGVPPGAAVTYTLSVTVCRDGGQPRDAHDPDRTLHAVDPRFTRDDVRRIFSPGAFHAGEAWVLHHRRAARAWTSSGSTSPTWAGRPSAPSWSCRWARRSSTSPPAGTRRCRWSTSRRTR